MKQKFPLAFFFGMVFFVGAFFFSSVWQATVAADDCFDAFGNPEIPCTYNPTTGSPVVVTDDQYTSVDTTSGGGGDDQYTSVRTATGAPIGGRCLYPTDCASRICDGPTGKCVASPSTSTPSTVSPQPSTTTTTPTTNSTTTTNANRPPVTTANGATSGLYIPTKADTGLSDMKVTDLIRNLMLWLLYIVGFIAIIAFVISGIQYLLAGASEEMAKKAKENMQYALIGVIVALSALIIIRAVQSVLLGASIF